MTRLHFQPIQGKGLDILDTILKHEEVASVDGLWRKLGVVIEEIVLNIVDYSNSDYLDVEIMRDDEVIVITIPASMLFEPNDTVLSKVGEEQLKPFLRMIKNPGFYKMLLVMHSDNTGSSEYTLNLTRQRVNAIFDWFDENGSVDYVVPYALGETDPIADNNSVENRKRNRRLEIYLVPEQTMLQQAKKGRINMQQKGK
jgi:outer membrane protein OmpA-like peptidoglycan-associated protein